MAAVLIIKLGAIGDVIMALPGVQQLHLQGHQIEWLCGAAATPILKLYPWIRVIPVNDAALLKGNKLARIKELSSIWRQLAGKRYTLVATLYYDSRYRVLDLPVRAGRKIRLSKSIRARQLLPGRHHTDEYARILLQLPDTLRSMQLAPVPPPSLPASPIARGQGRRVVLAPAGARNMMADDALRRWPAESYAQLTSLLLKQEVEVVLIGGPDDAWAQTYFQPLSVLDMIGKLTLLETLGLLEEADVLVTHDTGPLHLAGMTHCGIVALFGPTDPRGRLPQRPGAVALWGGEGFACRPCYDGRTFADCPQNDCIRQYTPTMVAAIVMAMLAERERGYLAAPRVETPESNVGGSDLVRLP